MRKKRKSWRRRVDSAVRLGERRVVIRLGKQKMVVPVWAIALCALFLFAVVGWAFANLAPTYDDIYLKVTKIVIVGETSDESYTWTGGAYSKTIGRGKWFKWYDGPGGGSHALTNPIIVVETGSIWSIKDMGTSERTLSNGTQYKIYEWEGYWEVAISAKGWLLNNDENDPTDKWCYKTWNYGPAWGATLYGVPEVVQVEITVRFSATWRGWRFGKAWIVSIETKQFWQEDSGDSDALYVQNGVLYESSTDFKKEIVAEAVEPTSSGALINAYFGGGDPSDPFTAPSMSDTYLVLKARLCPGYVMNVPDFLGAGFAQAYGFASVVFRFKVRIWALEKIDPGGGGGEEINPPDPGPDDDDKMREDLLEWFMQNAWWIVIAAIVVLGMMVYLLGPFVRGVGGAVGRSAQKAAGTRIGSALLFGLFIIVMVIILLFVVGVV